MSLETLTCEPPGETPARYVADRPITFGEFLHLSDRDNDYELIDGTLVKRMVAFADHESLLSWLHSLMTIYAQKRGIGKVWGSRTAVMITGYRVRLPDLVFLRTEHLDRLRQEAIFGTPDLVVEIASPNDRQSDLIALETDYRSIGVPEIVFIHQKKRRVRWLRKRGDDYDETTLTTGPLAPETVPGLVIRCEWLYDEPRPIIYDLLTEMLQGNAES